MTSFETPCVVCGRLSEHARCPTHARPNAYPSQWSRLSKTERARVGVCQCPGCPLHWGPCGSTDRLSLDHVIPAARGGPGVLSNTRVLCQPCNSSKGARPL